MATQEDQEAYWDGRTEQYSKAKQTNWESNLNQGKQEERTRKRRVSLHTSLPIRRQSFIVGSSPRVLMPARRGATIGWWRSQRLPWTSTFDILRRCPALRAGHGTARGWKGERQRTGEIGKRSNKDPEASISWSWAEKKPGRGAAKVSCCILLCQGLPWSVRNSAFDRFWLNQITFQFPCFLFKFLFCARCLKCCKVGGGHSSWEVVWGIHQVGNGLFACACCIDPNVAWMYRRTNGSHCHICDYAGDFWHMKHTWHDWPAIIEVISSKTIPRSLWQSNSCTRHWASPTAALHGAMAP